MRRSRRPVRRGRAGYPSPSRRGKLALAEAGALCSWRRYAAPRSSLMMPMRWRLAGALKRWSPLMAPSIPGGGFGRVRFGAELVF